MLPPARQIKSIAGLLLICCYLAATSRVDNLHALLHTHTNTVSHSPDQEKDHCHRAAYHGEKATCGHKLHLSRSAKCNLCHLVPHSDQVIPFATTQHEPTPSSATFLHDAPAPVVSIANDRAARAPPVI